MLKCLDSTWHRGSAEKMFVAFFFFLKILLYFERGNTFMSGVIANHFNIWRIVSNQCIQMRNISINFFPQK